MPVDNLSIPDQIPQDEINNRVDVAEIDKLLLEPYQYLAKNRGKELRSALIHAFNHWLNVPAEPLQVVADVVQMLHNASLIVDDIEDNSTLRRGQPAAHCVYGTSLSINSANMVYFLALNKLTALNRADVVKVFSEQMLELHRGQGMDILWTSTFNCPTEAEYREMVIRKTGGLFGLALRLLQLFSDNKKDYKPLIDSLGLLFQIRDDYANLVDLSYYKTKTFADDITEGKFSFPIIRCIRGHPEKTLVKNILFQHTSDLSLKKHCVLHMADLGVFDETVMMLADLEKRCLEMIDVCGGNPSLSQFLRKLGAIYRSNDGTLRKHSSADFNFPENDFASNCDGVKPCAQPNGEHLDTSIKRFIH